MRLSKSQALLDEYGDPIGGKWELNRKHEIQYTPDNKKERIKLKATILDVKPAAVVLAHTTKQDDGKIVTKTNELKGVWRADSKNRLTFLVKRQKGKNNILTFKKTWKINKNYEIEYTYKEETLKTKKKLLKRLTFRGFWDITEKNRITYLISKQSNSYFRFRGAFQTKSIYAKKGEIRYQIGIQAERKTTKRTLVLFGKWKYSRKVGFKFEVEYQGGKRHAITFGGTYALTDHKRLEVNLRNKKDQRLGIELILTFDFLKRNRESFVRLLRGEDESRIEAGLSFKW